MSSSESKSRQNRLVDKIVGKVIDLVMRKQPDVGMSDDEIALITQGVRRKAFSGSALSDADIKALVDQTIRSRRKVPSADNVDAGNIKSTTLDNEPSGKNDDEDLRSIASTSAVPASNAPSTRFSTRSLRSSHSKATTRRVEQQTATNDQHSLARLNDIIANTPTSKDEFWARKFMAEREEFLADQQRQRQKLLNLRREQQLALLDQVSVKRKREEEQRAEFDREQKEQMKKEASRSLEAEKLKREEKRKKQMTELERVKADREELELRKLTEAIKKQEEKIAADRDAEQARQEESQERSERRTATEELRDMLLSEVTRKQQEREQEALEKRDYEKRILDEMSDILAKERRQQEEARKRKIQTITETQEWCKQEEAKKHSSVRALESAADKETISQDAEFRTKEKLAHHERMARNHQLQLELIEQMKEKERRRASERQRDAEYSERQIAEDTFEAMEEQTEEREAKLERQRELREFLTVQKRAKEAQKTRGEVETSIARPHARTPVF